MKELVKELATVFHPLKAACSAVAIVFKSRRKAVMTQTMNPLIPTSGKKSKESRYQR
jgi:hypothetical protein